MDFLEPFFLHGFVARMNRRTLVRVYSFLIPSSILSRYPQSRMLAMGWQTCIGVVRGGTAGSNTSTWLMRQKITEPQT